MGIEGNEAAVKAAKEAIGITEMVTTRQPYTDTQLLEVTGL